MNISTKYWKLRSTISLWILKENWMSMPVLDVGLYFLFFWSRSQQSKCKNKLLYCWNHNITRKTNLSIRAFDVYIPRKTQFSIIKWMVKNWLFKTKNIWMIKLPGPWEHFPELSDGTGFWTNLMKFGWLCLYDQLRFKYRSDWMLIIHYVTTSAVIFL